MSALQVLRIMIETGKPLSRIEEGAEEKYPQAQRNLKVRRKAAAGIKER